MHTEYLGYKIRTITKKLRRQFIAYESIKGMGEVTRLNGWILGHLYDNQNVDIYQKNIEQQFDMCRSSTTGVLKSMEQKGYINRISVDSDARLKKIILTQKGIDTHLQIIKDIDMLDSSLFRNIPDCDIATFYKVLDLIEHHADENVENNFKYIIHQEETNA